MNIKLKDFFYLKIYAMILYPKLKLLVRKRVFLKRALYFMKEMNQSICIYLKVVLLNFIKSLQMIKK